MWRLWNFVKGRCKTDDRKRKAFLYLSTLAWAISAFIIMILIGLLYKQAGTNVLWNALLAACYAGGFIGFMGGCVFLMRNTPEAE